MTHAIDLDKEARRTLELIGPAPDNWVPDQPGIDHNVFIVGGGQTGCAFAFALRRAGIGRVGIIDAASDASQAGVWLTRARMKKLRTLKSLVGPEAGLPGLSFQAWYEARHGDASYQAIDRIARESWAQYLAWYREFLDIPIRYATRLVRIEPWNAHFRLHLEENGKARTETARKVLLCNGVAGNGDAFVPPALAGLPDSLAAHTSRNIDFSALRGKSVAVLGAAASAFDAAAAALEAGARSAHLFARRTALAAVPVLRARSYPGAQDNYIALPDALRWAQALRYKRSGSTAPRDAIERATRFPDFHLHLGAQWEQAREDNGKVVVTVAGETFQFDFVIAGTGYFVDPSARPELAGFAKHIRLWRDQYTPPDGQADDYLGAHPYLGSALEYQEKEPGKAPYLKNLHVYNPGGFVSTGLPLGDVPSMRYYIPAVVRHISRDLFFSDIDLHARRFDSEIPADFDESLYASSLWRSKG